MKKVAYIFNSGELQRKDNTIFFKNTEGKKNFVPVENIQEIYVFGEVSLTKKLLEYLTQKEITMHFYSYYGYYMGSYYPREHYNSGFMILKQVEHYMDNEKRKLLSQKIVFGAVENILKVLEYYKEKTDLESIIKEIEQITEKLKSVKAIEQMRAFEGQIRETYYQAFDKIINDKDFTFCVRSKRPPKNRLNALISFGNSLMYVTVLSQIYRTHLDPRIGYLHTTNFRKFSLNLDIAEIFKPIIVDRLIFTLLNKREIQKKHFLKEVGGIILNESGRKIFVRKFDEKLKDTLYRNKLKRKVSYRRIIRLECYKLEKHFMGDEEYKPFLSYW